MHRIDHGLSASVSPILFELTDAEFATVSRYDSSPLRWRRVSALVSFATSGFFVFGSWVSWNMHSEAHWWFLLVGIVNAGNGLVGLLTLKQTYPQCARRADLHVDAVGLAGEIDGRRLSLPWKAIDSVTDHGDFLIVRYAAARSVIPIPKRAVASLSDLWHTFDDRLTAKRGLIVRPGRRLIVNSARA